MSNHLTNRIVWSNETKQYIECNAVWKKKKRKITFGHALRVSLTRWSPCFIEIPFDPRRMFRSRWTFYSIGESPRRSVTSWNPCCDKSAGPKLRDTWVVIFKLMTRYNKVNGFMIAVSWDSARPWRRPSRRHARIPAMNALLAYVSREYGSRANGRTSKGGMKLRSD